MEKIKQLFIKYKEIILYFIFGVLTTLVNWVTYWLVEPLLDSAFKGSDFLLFSLDPAVFFGNFIAWVAGVAFAFVTNKIWVFESKSWKPSVAFKELWLFVTARLITGVLEWVGVPLLVAWGLDQKMFGVKGFVAKIIVSVIVIILNYVFSKLIIFKKKDKQTDKEQ